MTADSNSSKIDLKKIDLALSNLNHKTITKFLNDTLNIELFIKDDDLISKYYSDILIELVVCNISNELKPIHVLGITRFYENGKRNSQEIINNKMIQSILTVNKNRVYYDFKKYIVSNITGDKIAKFNAIIEQLIKNRKSTKPCLLKENDFILATMEYATNIAIK